MRDSKKELLKNHGFFIIYEYPERRAYKYERKSQTMVGEIIDDGFKLEFFYLKCSFICEKFKEESIKSLRLDEEMKNKSELIRILNTNIVTLCK